MKRYKIEIFIMDKKTKEISAVETSEPPLMDEDQFAKFLKVRLKKVKGDFCYRITATR